MASTNSTIEAPFIENISFSSINCITFFISLSFKFSLGSSTDIDIAWFTSKNIDLVTRTKFKNLLEEVLGIKVDLVLVDKNSTEYLLYNIFETGECIFVGSEEFDEWFDRFYDKTYLDREFLSIYLEEKFKYVY